MSVNYSILFESDDPIEVVKAQLEKLINSPFEFVEDWEVYDMYSTQVLGLWIGFHNRRDRPIQDDREISLDSYQVNIAYIREITGLSEGKNWERIAAVELARMITRNLKCESIVKAEDVITHRFEAKTVN